MDIAEKHKGFVFATVGIHPEFVKELKADEKGQLLSKIRNGRERICAIGETGLDFWYTKEPSWQRRQQELFIELITLAKQLRKPLVVHSRDAHEQAIEILEQAGAKAVLMHLFGAHHLLPKVLDHGWFISLGPILLRSKKHKKIARDTPIQQILLETDSPWFGIEQKRGVPTNIKFVAEKIAKVHALPFETVWQTCGSNAAKFFRLPVALK